MKFSKIKDNDIANGVGITMSLWTQGCPHHCRGCFNPETWNYTDGKEFTKEDLDYILQNIDKNNVKRNLAILGGEPLCDENVDGVLKLCKEFKNKYNDKMIYLWTGYVLEEFDVRQMQILDYVDVLVDGQFEEKNKNLSLVLRGSTNQRIIDVKQTVEKDDLIIYKIS